MNQDRRSKIIKIINAMESNKELLQAVLDDEQFSFDNMPENLQGSIRGMESEEAISTMEEAIEKIEEAMDELRNI